MDFHIAKAFTFDCYGTLIDWELGIGAVLQEWAKSQRLTVGVQRLLAAYADAEAHCESRYPDLPYSRLLRMVHREIAELFDLEHNEDFERELAGSVGSWPPFPDTVAALKQLKKTHKLVIVSNVDRRSFAETANQLKVDFAAVVTAEEVGAYKPDRRMFERALSVLEELGVAKNEIVHVAQSLYHDHVPAKAIGLRTVWVNRRSGRGGGAAREPDVDVHPDLTVESLAQLAELVRHEMSE